MGKTLTEIRKATTLDTAADIAKIAKLFKKIAETNPEAVKAVLPKMMHRDGKADIMVQFYADMADYLAHDFDTH